MAVVDSTLALYIDVKQNDRTAMCKHSGRRGGLFDISVEQHYIMANDYYCKQER